MTLQCGHDHRKVKARNLCGSCYNSYLMNRSKEIKEKVLANNRKNWAKRYSARISDDHALKQKNRGLRHRYGIDLDEYNRMHDIQNNKCAICGKHGGTTKGTKLYVDHNHTTGAVRQLLCPSCNQGIGALEQGTERIVELVKYLLKHDKNSQAFNALAALELELRK